MAYNYAVTINGVDYDVDADYDDGDASVGMPAGYAINKMRKCGSTDELPQEEWKAIEDEVVEHLWQIDADEEPDYDR